MTTYARKRTFLPDTIFSSPQSSTSITSESQSKLPSTAKLASQPASIRAFFKPIVPAAPAPPSPPQRKKPRLLTQTTIDLGGDPRRTCTLCGMQYLPAAPEDVKTHAKFCARAAAASEDAIAGVEASVREMDGARVVWRGAMPVLAKRKAGTFASSHGKRKGKAKIQDREWGSGEACILEISRRSSGAARLFAERLLGIAEEELGAVKVQKEALWGVCEKRAGEKEDAFKAYVHVVAGRGVGLCLAQRVHRARSVVSSGSEKKEVPDNDGEETQERGGNNESDFKTSSELVEGMVMGISRIWVARDMRSAGLARELLHAARKFFVLGRTLKMEETAFSQPTTSGLRLARKWYGAEAGWHVYDGRIEEDSAELGTE